MSYFKMVGLLLLAASCTLGGALKGNGYHRRVSALESARTLLLWLRGQLVYTLSPPAVLLQDALNDPGFSRCDYLIKACHLIDCGEEVQASWNCAVSSSKEPFTNEDRAQISRTGEILGKSDLDTQLSQLALLAQRLDQQADQARGEASVQARLCTTLGALCGLALVILLC